MRFEEFKEGDYVAVVGQILGKDIPVRRQVKRVMKRFVELNDGTKWTPTGYPYPQKTYPTQHIDHWSGEHAINFMLARVMVCANRVKTASCTKPKEASLEKIKEAVDSLVKTVNGLEKLFEGTDEEL